jgi:hypothetical protein
MATMNEAFDRAIQALLAQIPPSPSDASPDTTDTTDAIDTSHILRRALQSLADPRATMRISEKEANEIAPALLRQLTPAAAKRIANILHTASVTLPVIHTSHAKSLQPLLTLLHAVHRQSHAENPSDDPSDDDDDETDLFFTIKSMLLATTHEARQLQQRLQLGMAFALQKGVPPDALAAILCHEIIQPVQRQTKSISDPTQRVQNMDRITFQKLYAFINQPTRAIHASDDAHRGAFAALQRAFRTVTSAPLCPLRRTSSLPAPTDGNMDRIKAAIVRAMNAGDTTALQAIERKYKKLFERLYPGDDDDEAPPIRPLYVCTVKKELARQLVPDRDADDEYCEGEIDPQPSYLEPTTVQQRRATADELLALSNTSDKKRSLVAFLTEQFAALLSPEDRHLLQTPSDADAREIRETQEETQETQEETQEAKEERELQALLDTDSDLDLWGGGMETMRGGGDGDDEEEELDSGVQRELLTGKNAYDKDPISQPDLQSSWFQPSHTLTPLQALQPVDPSFFCSMNGDPVVTLGSLSEGSCFQHSLLMAINPAYQQHYLQQEYRACKRIALRFRRQYAARKLDQFQQFSVDHIQSMPHLANWIREDVLKTAFGFDGDDALLYELSDLNTLSTHAIMNWFADQLGVQFMVLNVNQRRIFCGTHSVKMRNKPLVILAMRSAPKPARVLARRPNTKNKVYRHIELVGVVREVRVQNGRVALARMQTVWGPNDPEAAYFLSKYDGDCPCVREQAETASCPLPRHANVALDASLRSIQMGRAADAMFGGNPLHSP